MGDASEHSDGTLDLEDKSGQVGLGIYRWSFLISGSLWEAIWRHEHSVVTMSPRHSDFVLISRYLDLLGIFSCAMFRLKPQIDYF